ncbi:hypothetical protein ACFQ40_00090 [Kroppenstedtia eburnea]|uniref:hypothetical protein n=1 Tax=Kroppenstedtia eburnea TaxID=714067 RepID=UPI00363DBDC0
MKFHDPEPHYRIPLETDSTQKPEGVRFLGGSLADLKQMTEAEFEEAKEKARRWQPTSR